MVIQAKYGQDMAKDSSVSLMFFFLAISDCRIINYALL